jgi:hypothetical protein
LCSSSKGGMCAEWRLAVSSNTRPADPSQAETAGCVDVDAVTDGVSIKHRRTDRLTKKPAGPSRDASSKTFNRGRWNPKAKGGWTLWYSTGALRNTGKRDCEVRRRRRQELDQKRKANTQRPDWWRGGVGSALKRRWVVPTMSPPPWKKPAAVPHRRTVTQKCERGLSALVRARVRAANK